ncbi:MAG: hypothetical protein ABIH03_04325 [Pseudomonadota bacterium]
MTLMAREIAREIVATAINLGTLQHIESCPHGKNLNKWRAWIIGVGVGCSAGGTLSGFTIAKWLM